MTYNVFLVKQEDGNAVSEYLGVAEDIYVAESACSFFASALESLASTPYTEVRAAGENFECAVRYKIKNKKGES